MKRILVLFVAVAMMLSASCGFGTEHKSSISKNNGYTEEVNASKEESAEITLYYTDKDAAWLCAELRQVPADKTDDASFVIKELLKGTENKELVNVIPEGTKVNSCTTKDGLCTLDLSEEFISKSGTANEQMSIYSVVNTLCLLDSVEQVRFLIDGSEVMIFGSYIFDEPFGADITIIK